jgi:hypothetical protein
VFTSLTKKQLIKLTLAYLLIALTGCGGGSSSNDSANTNNISLATIRTDLNKGITQGLRSSINSFSTVFANSNVFSKISTNNANRANRSQLSALDVNATKDQINNFLGDFGKLIDKSDISQDANVYTFNPRETEICAEVTTSQNATNCEALLANIIFVVTVDKVENNSNVTAATTVFQYESIPFATIGFDDQSGYYQIDLAGTKSLLTGINRFLPEADRTQIASIVEGSIRLSSYATSDNSGSLTLSIPTALHIRDNTRGELVDISIEATNKLVSMTANSDKKTMELEVSLGALNLTSSDNDDFGNSFPVQLALNAITGKLAVTENGDKLALTGITANAVTFNIGGREAVNLNFDSFNALIDSSAAHTLYTLNSALNFDLSINNIQQYFDATSSDSNQLRIKAYAPAGTVITDLDQNMIKVTNGNLKLKVEDTGKSVINSVISSEECLNTVTSTSFGLVSCPVGI